MVIRPGGADQRSTLQESCRNGVNGFIGSLRHHLEGRPQRVRTSGYILENLFKGPLVTYSMRVVVLAEVRASLMTFIRLTLCALSGFLVLTGSAFANINYTLTSGNDTITFSIPQLPAVQAPCSYFGDTAGFCVSPVALIVDGSPITGDVGFYQPGVGGGLVVCTGQACAAGTVLVNNGGPGNEQLFTGTLAAPTLLTFSNIQLFAAPAGSPLYNEAFVLNATSSAATPEPGSFAALILGLGSVMLVARSRRVKQRG